ncbi:hypothetical protein CC2G_007557 [Coprinopsis cinerea AmutBmut pab1-1]|nr:hypothetical protein CC2G_007557 [Coprinopsis cinerea AmutBmut pab1-1]
MLASGQGNAPLYAGRVRELLLEIPSNKRSSVWQRAQEIYADKEEVVDTIAKLLPFMARVTQIIINSWVREDDANIVDTIRSRQNSIFCKHDEPRELCLSALEEVEVWGSWEWSRLCCCRQVKSIQFRDPINRAFAKATTSFLSTYTGNTNLEYLHIKMGLDVSGLEIYQWETVAPALPKLRHLEIIHEDIPLTNVLTLFSNKLSYSLC